jgi:hypothetical protein
VFPDREEFEGIWRGVDTGLLGRTNYEGFYSVWPDITRDSAGASNPEPRGPVYGMTDVDCDDPPALNPMTAQR